MIHFTRHIGAQAQTYFADIAALRIEVFRDFPYLYDGTEEYEAHYLQTYFSSYESFLCLCWDDNQVVGASTGIPLEHEEDVFQRNFLKHGIDPKSVFYFGESVLRETYRGKGIGKTFFEEREKFARSLRDFSYLSFCAVERPLSHPARPKSYKALDPFWHRMGFQPKEGLVTDYSWKDVGDANETKKRMQFWLKSTKE